MSTRQMNVAVSEGEGLKAFLEARDFILKHRDDYASAGIRLLPVVEPDAKSTGRQVVTNCLALVVVGLMPTLVGLAGSVYFVVALTLGLGFLGYGIAFSLARTAPSARQLLLASLVYLPVLLIVMALDKLPSMAFPQ